MNGTRKQKNLSKDTGIAVTLTYKNHYGICPKDQYSTSVYEVIRHLKACCDHYEISPECTTRGDIHYHLTLVLRDRVKWFKSVLPRFKRNGYVCVKPCDDPDGWRVYCTKDNTEMKEILDLPHDLPITPQIVKLHYGKARREIIDWEDLHNDIMTYFAA